MSRNKCKEGQCIAGYIGSKQVKVEEWEQGLKDFEREIEEFNTTRRAIPHPGFVRPFRFCVNCGSKLKTSQQITTG